MTMSKKNTIHYNENKILAFEDVMSDRFGRYSKYIIQERALPDVRDGLKPVQRRILYAMHVDKNTFERQHRKSAKTVGLVIGNYHPHGDSSVYDAMVRMSQPWKMNHPLIDMHGNNGSIDDDPAAAMRYTEARLSKIASTMLEDLNYKTVNFASNFDDTDQEPVVFPARFPLLLVNGTSGIAVGVATNIPSHNLSEVVDATIHLIQNPNSTVEELCQFVLGPDFPTGGIVQGKKGIMDAYKSGKGKIVIRAKTKVEDAKSIQQIIITEIPYGVVKAKLVEKIDDIRLKKDIDGILDVRDESDREGLKITLDIKKDINPELILNYLYKNTELQIYYNFNMLAIVDNTPKDLSLKQILKSFIEHRKEVVLRRSRYQLSEMDKRCHILEGLIKAVTILDEIIEMIRASNDKKDAILQLMQRFMFTEVQADAIVSLRLYRLTNTDVKALKEEFANLINEMEMLKLILSNEHILNNVIVQELKEIKKDYAEERKTRIEDEVSDIVIDKSSMITSEKVMVTVSKDGYLKRVSLRSYSASEHTITGLKENDEWIGHLQVDTLDTLLIFTSAGNYAYLPVYEIREAKWKDIGFHLNNYVKIDADEKIISVIHVCNFDSYAYIVTATKLGMIKKTMLSHFKTNRYNKLYCAMKLKAKDEVIHAQVVYHEEDLILLSKDGYVVRYHQSLLPSVKTKSQGVKAQNFASKDYLAAFVSVHPQSSEALLIGTTKGNFKRIKVSDISYTSRPVKGEMITKKLKTTPYQMNYLALVSPYHTISFVSDTIEEVIAKDVPIMDKQATFSTLVNVKDNSYILKGIQEAKIIDKPEGLEEETVDVEEQVFQDYEVINLFNERS